MISEAPTSTQPRPPAAGFLWRFFQPAPPAATVITEPSEIARQLRSWQIRVLFLTILGYATYYFVRKNLSVAMPVMERNLGIGKDQLGLFITLHGLLYGVSKFANGFLGDRANARSVMVVGLCISALLSISFGFSSAVIAFGVIWMANGWFQGMGFPPCARLMTNWFSPKEFATKFSIWNISHNIGSILILLLSGFLVSGSLFAPNWRLCFLVPAVVAIVIAILLWFSLPDTPPSVGLPEIAGTHVDLPEKDSHEDHSAFVRRQVFGNKFIWLFAAANFFVYSIRYAVFDWGPTMLLEAKHIKIMHAAWMMAGFEAFGAVGALLGGWITDRFFGGRVVRACIIYMALAGVSLALFWKAAGQSWFLNTALLCATGFFIYGPQCLVGIAAANLATKQAAATAVGLTGLFGYASTLLSGWGLGLLVKYHGWDAGFACMLATAAIGAVLFAVAWRAKAHGYKC